MATSRPILIVEDHADTRAAMVALLRHVGYTVVEAASVAEGLAKVDGQFAAVLDLNLTDGLGTEVARHIRTASPAMRIAFVTAWGDDALLADARALADAVFRKPLDVAKLLQWLAANA